MKSQILNEADIKTLEESLKFHKRKMDYYVVLGIIMIIFSWLLYLTLKSPSLFLTAGIISISIWYFPLRYYKKVKAISLDLCNKQKIEIRTTIYGKSISKINRLEPYYYIYTEEETFEVKKAIFNNLQKKTKVHIIYAADSKIILEYKIIQ